MKVLRDSWLMFKSQFNVSRRNPVWLFIGMFQPICYLLLFAPLLKNLVGMPGFPRGGAYNIFTPGLMVMMAIFGVGFAGFGIIGRLRSGFIERMRVTPVSRLAMILGTLGVDICLFLVQLVLLVGVGLLLGFRPDPGGLALLALLLILSGMAMACFSYALALLFKDESGLAASINLVVLPLLLLSGTMLPLSFAPETLRNIAKANPFAYAVDASRALVAGNPGDSSVVKAFVILGVLAIITTFWATRSMRQAAM
ncbi:MAG TPA: ABC transporter permease [Ktedonobacterales bacterium]|jgi:ABC-2 type transport system permease protein|nr:ABC transporter permease [Ktedonobacterales bacterium]